MCGIYITNLDHDINTVQTKLNSINFRGPDNLGTEKIDKIILGHLRLSILDLEKRSNQPMWYRNLVITFNGEIYNYRDLRKQLEQIGFTFTTESDTEVLLISYFHWGRALLDRINGMFAFCIYDTKEQKVFCARDRIGVKPFYYFWKDGAFEICSQIRPLINKNSSINEEAIGIYLDCGYIPSPYSAIKDIYKLPPGMYLEIDLQKAILEKHNYWDINEVKKTTTNSYKESKKELHALLKDSVRIRLQSDVLLGSFLSGGIDSALITAVASKISKSPINTFSIGFKDKKYDESKVAEKYAEILGTNHKTIICKPEDILELIPKYRTVYDEPFADSSALPSLLLNKVTKEFVTVALSGDGGDESFLGYNYFQFLKKHRPLYLLPSWLRQVMIRLNLLPLFRKLLKKEISVELFSLKDLNAFVIYFFTGGGGRLQKKQNTQWLSYYTRYQTLSKNFLQKAADFNIKLWLENDSNVKVDRASMAYSVEVRSPFLDYRIIEMARTMPIPFRYKKTVRKHILRDILKEYIPEEVFDQPKKGFSVPLGHWIRNELREEFLAKLNDDFLNIVPNLDVPKFKKNFAMHMNNEGDFKTDIWKLYVLRQWYEEFGFYQEQSYKWQTTNSSNRLATKK
jgi:asparagine synthase (glutamine-hydrolysing)